MGSRLRKLRRATAPAPVPKPRVMSIAFGVGCTWWDSVDKTARNAVGLPCCPHCKGLLMETDTADWETFAHQQQIRDPDYLGLLEFMRGKCFPTLKHASEAYAKEHSDG